MRPVFLNLAALAVAAVLTAPAAAQTNPSRLNPRPAPISEARTLSDADRGRRAMDGYAECLLQYNSSKARRFIGTYPNAAGMESLIRELEVDECIAAGEVFSHAALLRGGLYTVLYRKEFRRPLSTISAPPIDYVADAPGPDAQGLGQYVALRAFADCVARRDPVNAGHFVLTQAGTNREDEALQALMPHFGTCMDSGLTVEFSEAMLVALVAESLYRLSTATREVGGR